MRMKGGIVDNTARVNLLESRNKTMTFDKLLMTFLRKTMMFPLTADFAD
jgi:hypothetical protein